MEYGGEKRIVRIKIIDAGDAFLCFKESEKES